MYKLKYLDGTPVEKEYAEAIESDVQTLIQFAHDQGWDIPEVMEAATRIEMAHAYESDVQTLIQFAHDQGWDIPEVMEAAARIKESDDADRGMGV